MAQIIQDLFNAGQTAGTAIQAGVNAAGTALGIFGGHVTQALNTGTAVIGNGIQQAGEWVSNAVGVAGQVFGAVGGQATDALETAYNIFRAATSVGTAVAGSLGSGIAALVAVFTDMGKFFSLLLSGDLGKPLTRVFSSLYRPIKSAVQKLYKSEILKKVWEFKAVVHSY